MVNLNGTFKGLRLGDIRYTWMVQILPNNIFHLHSTKITEHLHTDELYLFASYLYLKKATPDALNILLKTTEKCVMELGTTKLSFLP